MNPSPRRFLVHQMKRLALLLVGISLGFQSSCQRHPLSDLPDPATPGALAGIETAREREIIAFCSGCHVMPRADSFPKSAWFAEVKRGFDFHHVSNRKSVKPPPVQAVVDYFRSRAPETLEVRSIRSVPGPDNIRFQRQEVLGARNESPAKHPSISFVSPCTLTANSSPVLLFSDMSNGTVSVSDLKGADSRLLIQMNNPAFASRCDLNGNGRQDLVIGELGSFAPEDHDRGKVVWIPDIDQTRFPQNGITILEGIGRGCDVQPADFDADGDIDLVVAEFGWHQTGRVLYLQNAGTTDAPAFGRPVVIDPRSGAIHVPVVDLNRDGRPDFVALISQEFEVIEAFLNQGDGTFSRQTIFAADDPAFGSSGIQMVDLDQDGDQDVLYTNGDMFDSFLIKPYYGIQWLENTGSYPFKFHSITPFPGVLRAVAGDIDGDGDLDIVGAAFLPESALSPDDAREQESLIWLEQTSPGQFVRHPLEKGNCIRAAVALADFDQDGDLDIASGAFRSHGAPSDSAVTIWWNQLVTR